MGIKPVNRVPSAVMIAGLYDISNSLGEQYAYYQPAYTLASLQTIP